MCVTCTFNEGKQKIYNTKIHFLFSFLSSWLTFKHFLCPYVSVPLMKDLCINWNSKATKNKTREVFIWVDLMQRCQFGSSYIHSVQQGAVFARARAPSHNLNKLDTSCVFSGLFRTSKVLHVSQPADSQRKKNLVQLLKKRNLSKTTIPGAPLPYI